MKLVNRTTKKYKDKIAPLVLIAVFSSSFYFSAPINAQTSTSLTDVGALAPHVPTRDSSANLRLEAINQGIGADPLSIARNLINPATILGEACAKVIQTVDTVEKVAGYIDTFTTASSKFLGFIGGDGLDTAALMAKRTKLQGELDGCWKPYRDALSGSPATTLLSAQEKYRKEAMLNQIIATIEQHIADLTAQIDSGWKDVAKAFMVKTILTLNKNLTTQLVNRLMEKYQINDYLAYGDALATQVYSMKYIDQNFKGDARKQLMLRSLIQSEKFPQQAKVAISLANQEANEFMNNACSSVGQLDANSSNSLRCLARMGDVGSSPMFRYMNALDVTQAVKAEGQKNAYTEISQSNGYAPPRNCSGSVAQQAQIDAQILAATEELEAAKVVLGRLNYAAAHGTNVPDEELKKAQDAVNAAQAKKDDLVKSSGGIAIDICEAISSPASFVGEQINGFLQRHLEQSSQLKTENLPFFASFLSDVTSNFLTNLLTGGKSKSQVFKEAGLQALGGAIMTLPQSIGGSGGSTEPITPASINSGAVQIYATRPGSNERLTTLQPGQNYILVVDFEGLMSRPNNSKDPRFNPARIMITGINSSSQSSYILEPGDLRNGRVTFDLGQVTSTFTIGVTFRTREADGSEGQIPGNWSQTFTVSNVRGAQTTVFNPRGELVTTGTSTNGSFRIR